MPSGIITKKLWILGIIFVLIVVGIAVASNVFEIKSSVEPTSFVTIGDLANNVDQYTGKNITIRGFYYQGDLPVGEGYLTSDHVELPIHDGSFDNVDYLKLNTSGFNNDFVDDVEYYVTGSIESLETSPYPVVIFSVEDVSSV